jgi:hypothetical protein
VASSRSDRRYDVAGSDPELVYIDDAGPPPQEPADEVFAARITLRWRELAASGRA